jgi:hypothetical protein
MANALNLHHQGPAQKRSDDDKQAQNHDILQRWFENHGSYDVCRNKKFQTEQQPLAELTFVSFISELGLAREVREKPYAPVDNGNHDNNYCEYFESPRG